MSEHGVTPFCVPGRHAYEAPTGTLSEGAGLPEDWYMERASVRNGVWVHDESSPAKIVHCGEHPLDPPS